jgi:Zn-finger nucleic acid-binding protein
MLSDKPNDFLISTIDQMEDRESDKIYEQQQKEWKKKKKALKWE